MIISGPLIGYAVITSVRAFQDWKRRKEWERKSGK